MTKEERELSITYLEEMKETYIEGEGYERHPLPEYYAIECAIKALEQEPILDKVRAKIEQLPTTECTETHRIYIDADDFKENVLAIIDKYITQESDEV